MKTTNSSRRRVTITAAALAVTTALSLGLASPASALTRSGYAIGGKSATTTQTTFSKSDPIVISAPSMASSEGCPAEVDDDVQVTMIHPDGVEYNCNTGEYSIS